MNRDYTLEIKAFAKRTLHDNPMYKSLLGFYNDFDPEKGNDIQQELKNSMRWAINQLNREAIVNAVHSLSLKDYWGGNHATIFKAANEVMAELEIKERHLRLVKG